MNKRLPSLLLAPGLALLLIGLTLWQLTPTIPTVQAALPPHHPALASLDVQQGAVITATFKDLFLPGTQPHQMIDELASPATCRGCHADYAKSIEQSAEYEPWTGWAGSMMAQSGRDPLFFAALDVANADVFNSGEYCLRCHMPRGWLEGRSTTTDGSAMTSEDQEGVQCTICHRMVDPVYTAGDEPERDLAVLATLTTTVSHPANAMMVVDPEDYRRGPFDVVADFGQDPHLLIGAKNTLQASYTQESALCGTCHDIDNPIYSWDESSESYILNAADTPLGNDKPFAVERTYSEWLLSDYNSPEGIRLQQFGGNKANVSTCQDCHMRDVTGKGAAFFGNPTNVPERTDLPMHDLTGVNTWVPQIIPLHPAYSQTFNVTDPERKTALISGTIRARNMLQNAANMQVLRLGDELRVVIVNNSGHKLPTGYTEGRRMWIQVEGYNISNTLIYTSGAYDVETATLYGYRTDPSLKVYEAYHGISDEVAAQLGVTAGESFHFMLNNEHLFDNRIPPRGYNYEAFLAVDAPPYTNGEADPTRYDDGQFWDVTIYTLPNDVVSGTVRLLHQVASKEYIEFLRDNNNPESNNGQILYDLWEATERSRPEVMHEVHFNPTAYNTFIPVMRTMPSGG